VPTHAAGDLKAALLVNVCMCMGAALDLDTGAPPASDGAEGTVHRGVLARPWPAEPHPRQVWLCGPCTPHAVWRCRRCFQPVCRWTCGRCALRNGTACAWTWRLGFICCCRLTPVTIRGCGAGCDPCNGCGRTQAPRCRPHARRVHRDIPPSHRERATRHCDWVRGTQSFLLIALGCPALCNQRNQATLYAMPRSSNDLNLLSCFPALHV
jgi:hypothetical protein